MLQGFFSTLLAVSRHRSPGLLAGSPERRTCSISNYVTKEVGLPPWIWVLAALGCADDHVLTSGSQDLVQSRFEIFATEGAVKIKTSATSDSWTKALPPKNTSLRIRTSEGRLAFGNPRGSSNNYHRGVPEDVLQNAWLRVCVQCIEYVEFKV